MPETSYMSCMSTKLQAKPLLKAHPIANWQQQYAQQTLPFSSAQTEALAHLVPLLLCGEQSAQIVFQQQSKQLSEQQIQLPLQALAEVEADEAWHDASLQGVFAQLPELPGQHKVRRQAQRFYTSLGRCQDLSEQFVRIASLDASVTLLMQMLERGELGRHHPLSYLCGLIKRDEAKHVYVSKHFAKALNADKNQEHEQRWSVLDPLVSLLLPQAEHFETLGVDLDRFKQQLERKWQ